MEDFNALIDPRCKEASFVRNIWVATPDVKTPYEHVLKQEFWVHVAHKMKPMDRIEVHAEDGSYFAELMVIDAGKAFAKVAEMRKINFTRHEVGVDSDDYDVSFIPAKRWRVIRKSDKQVMAEELPTKDEAMLWIANHKKTV